LGLPGGTLVTPAVAGFRQNDINREETWGTRVTARWTPIERLRIDLNYTLQDARLGSEEFTDPVAAGPYEQQRSLEHYFHSGERERLTIGTLTGEYSWDALSVISISNWMRMKRVHNQDITFLAFANFGAPVPWGYTDSSLGRVFTQEIRLQSRGEHKLQW